MIKYLDKLKEKLKRNKKMIIFLVGLFFVGIISGSFFVVLLKETDQTLLKEYLTSFITNIETGNLNYQKAFLNTIGGNLFSVILIWLLGISVIGIPIILFMFFTKSFVLGFSITSILLNYRLKGCLIAFFYVFPHHVINILLYIMLLMYSLTLSYKILKAMIKKESFPFKTIIKTYSKILFCSILGIFLTTILEIYLVPVILKTMIPFLK